MAKGKSTWKYNKLLTARRNYYNLGGSISGFLNKIGGNPDDKGTLTTGAFKGLSSTGSGILGATANAVGQIGGKAIAGGLESGAGNFISGLQGIAGAIPGPWGAVASAGLGLVGGLTNRIAGSKLNQENINAVKGAIERANSVMSNAADFDTLSNTMNNTTEVANFSNSFIGKDGWASNRASKLASSLRREAKAANQRQALALLSNAEDISSDTLMNLEANYAAFGGPMDFGGGAIGYDFINQYLGAKKLAALGQDEPLSSLPNSFAEGGGIHIKKANRGKFTEYCGGNVTSECIARGKRSSSPAVRKRATFAANARNWKHALGGNLFEGGGSFEDDYAGNKATLWDRTLTGKLVNYAENRDSVGFDSSTRRWYAPPSGKGYDTNNRGMGVDINENPYVSTVLHKDAKGSYITEKDERMVRYKSLEDAENSYNARVAYAQKRFKSSKTPSEKKKALTMSAIYNLGSGYVARNLFEDEALMKSLLDGTDEEYMNQVHKYYRKKGRNERVALEREYINSYAFGGDLLTHGANFDTGVTLVGNGGTHEENPLEGVPMGMDAEGTPNLVEEGEVIFNDYVFSNRLRVPKEVRKKYKLRGTKPLTFAEAATQMSKESEERPNDPISRAGLEDSMMKLMIAQEQLRNKNERNRFAKGGSLGRKYAGLGNLPNQLLLDSPIDINDTSWMDDINLSNEDLGKDKGNGLAPTWMRYVPAYASGIMSITDAMGLTNKPDYTEADMVLEAARGAGTYSPVGFSPIGNYLGYTPFDREFYINQMNAQAGATRRAIMQNAGLNRGAGMAALLASDYNTQGQLGQLSRQAEEYNLAQRQKVEEFNRATDMFNTEGALKADMANQEAQLKVRDSLLKGTLSAAELRQREKQQAAVARSANLSNFINSLGDIGRENFARNMIVSDPSKYYSVGDDGEITYKASFDDLSEAEQDYVRGYASRKSQGKKAKRGYLTRKKRR